MAFWDMNNQHNADAPLWPWRHLWTIIYRHHKPSLWWGGVTKFILQVWGRDAKERRFPPVLLGIPKNGFFLICDYMRHSTTRKQGSISTIYDVMCRVMYSKYTTYDVSHMRFYATCQSFLHRIGRVAGL